MKIGLKAIAISVLALASVQLHASPPLPGEKCRVAPHESWTADEAWVWIEICEGRVADFNQRYESIADPKLSTDWENNSQDRRISQNFLETVLLHTPWRTTIPRQGFRVSGALFLDKLNFDRAKIEHDISFKDSRFMETFSARDATFNEGLSFEGSVFVRNIGTKDTEADTEPNKIERSRRQPGIFLGEVNIRGNLYMRSSEVSGYTSISAANIDGSLYIDGGKFKGFSLNNSKVGGFVDMTTSAFGLAILNNIETGDDIELEFSTFDMFWLVYGKVGGDLNIQNANFLGEVDLTGTNVTGELRFDDNTRWGAGDYVSLILNNTHVGAFQGGTSSLSQPWPNQVWLNGFTYDQIGGGFIGNTNHMLERDITWYIDWLAHDPSNSPQPYEQLASVFRQAGYFEKANDILYASRERQRLSASGAPRLGLELLKWTIGYGLGKRYFRALWWVVGLVILGMIVLRISGEGIRNKMPYGFSFSLDHLLPIVTLRKYHFDVTLNGWARYYFYAHKLMGYVLASFLIAGMAGLTQ